MVWLSCAVGPPPIPLVEGWDAHKEVRVLYTHTV